MASYPPPSLDFNTFNVNSRSSESSQNVILNGRNENNTTLSNIGATSQNNLKVSIKEPLSAFGEVMVVNPTPRIQVDAVYGIIDTEMEQLTASGGTCTGTNSLFTVSTGTTLGAYAVLRSRRLIAYKAGEGIRLRFTAKFSTGVANSLQLVGGFNSYNGLFFGYNGSEFGLLRRIPGSVKIVRLEITNAGGAETITINLNSVAFNYVSAGGHTASQLAELIADNVSFTGWIAKSNTQYITFIQNTPATANGTYSLTSAGTAVGTFTSLQNGSPNDDTTGFVPITEWNLDKCDGSHNADNPSGILLDPSKLNVYQIVLPYLGGGCILFSLMDQEGHFELVHQIEYPNNFTVPNQSNPTYKLGWISASLGSTTNLTVQGASLAGFIEGALVSRAPPNSFSRGNFTASTTEYTIFALRNRGEFSNTINLREFAPINLTAGTETGNRILTVRLYLNPTLNGETIWNYVNQSRSCVEYANPTNLAPTSGIVIASFICASGSPITIDLSNLNLRITPSEILALSVQTASSTAVVNVSLNWNE
jgi:hypothetical protein